MLCSRARWVLGAARVGVLLGWLRAGWGVLCTALGETVVSRGLCVSGTQGLVGAPAPPYRPLPREAFHCVGPQDCARIKGRFRSRGRGIKAAEYVFQQPGIILGALATYRLPGRTDWLTGRARTSSAPRSSSLVARPPPLRALCLLGAWKPLGRRRRGAGGGLCLGGRLRARRQGEPWNPVRARRQVEARRFRGRSPPRPAWRPGPGRGEGGWVNRAGENPRVPQARGNASEP